MKTFLGTLALAAMIVPAAAFAQTSNNNAYEFVNTSGMLQIVQAPDAMTALVTAPNIAPTSGVMFLTAQNEIPTSNTVSL